MKNMKSMKSITKAIGFTCIALLLFHTCPTMAESETVEPQQLSREKSKEKGEHTPLAKDKEDTEDTTEAAAFKKMTPKQVARYLNKKINSENTPGGLFWLIPILVPMAFFATILIPICVFFLFRFRATREKQITLRTMADKGVHIPPEMFADGLGQSNSVDKDRRRGFLFTLSSIGLIVFLFLIETTTPGVWSLGLIPLLLGVGYLISWKLAEKDK